ncbi:MAG: hypothetical protein QOE20_681 [Mycobacterium sp.]|nr:hypothetical protein [Mycobacterium sp.]
MEFTALWPGADAVRTTRELSVGFRDGAETFRDTVSWMYGAGHLAPAQVGKLADNTSLR